jgi:hypothetical protein
MVLLVMTGREWIHALLRMPGSAIISRLRGEVNGEMAEFGGSFRSRPAQCRREMNRG